MENLSTIRVSIMALVVTAVVSLHSQAALVVTADGGGTGSAAAFPGSFTAPSGTDLAESGSSTFGSFSVSGLTLVEVANLNDGIVGTVVDDNRAPVESTDSFTINFDISVNTLGYDITGINSIAGWNSVGGGRANQGYDVTVTYLNDTTLQIASGTFYANTVGAAGENGTVNSWTEVLLTDSAGTLASGVKAITFDNFDDAVPGGTVQYREFDVFGAATVPEPSTFALLSLGLGSLVLMRRRR